MKKLYSILLVVLMSLCSVVNADTVTEPSYEKAAAVRWVMDNASVDLSYSRAMRIVDHVYENASKVSLDPVLLLAVMRTESGFNEMAKSPVGAKGLMQVLPRWHKDKLKGRNPYRADVSIEVGSIILKDCVESQRGNLRKSLHCYLGGVGTKYSNMVIAYRKEIQKSIIYDLFKPDYTQYAMK